MVLFEVLGVVSEYDIEQETISVFFKGIGRQMDSVSTLIFQKKFNKVHYQKLLKKLIYHGIEEKTV